MTNRTDVSVGLPRDSLSSLAWSRSSLLAGASWDGTISIWSIERGEAVSKGCKQPRRGPLLSCSWSPDGKQMFAGGCSSELLAWNPQDDIKAIGKHKQPISCVNADPSDQLVATGSWDKTVAFWDPRQSAARPAVYFSVPDRVYSMDFGPGGEGPVVATASRHILYLDRRAPDKPKIQMSSPLPFQSRCIRFTNKEATKFVIASVSGMCAHVDVKARKSVKFLGSCEESVSVNTVSVHPSGYLAIGDSGGSFSLWNIHSEPPKAISPARKGDHPPVTAVAFNSNMQLAVSRGYDGIRGTDAKPTLSVFALKK